MAFFERLKLGARGSDEASWVDGRRFEFLQLWGPEMDSMMTVDRMIGSSIFSVDRARRLFASTA